MSDRRAGGETHARVALHEGEERFRMLADNISQLAWTCDLLGNVTWYNKRWLEYTGLAFEDMKGWDWAKVQHPDHVARVVARVQRSGETGEPWEDTFPLRGRDGQYRWFLSRAVPIRDEHGTIVQWFGTNTDVTEQKLAEEQVARQAQELRELNARLLELDRLKSEFFSNISHEFRTPLALMLGPAEDLLSSTDGQIDAGQRENLELLHRNAQRLHKLVNALLDFSRIEAGRIRPLYESLDLAELTRDLVSTFRSTVERAGLVLTCDCHSLGQPVAVDRGMWEKIVLNLLSNAFKFTFEGGIHVSLRLSGDYIVLRVRDTGVGIPATEIPRLFERFRRIEATRARTHEGSGIGLALVKELAALHGGTVDVESAVDAGTTFTVTIPQAAHPLELSQDIAGPGASLDVGAAFVGEARRWLPSALADSITASAAAATGHGRRSATILLADDNADMRDYVRRLLEPHWNVVAVDNGADALATARDTAPDLILADVMMPGLDGFALLRQLRTDDRTRSIPVVMLSARAGEEARVDGLQAGAEDYLTKPFAPRELVARVRTHLELARRRDEMRAQREHFYALLMQAPVPICVFRGHDLVFEMANPLYEEIVGQRDVVGKPLLDLIPESARQGFDDLLRGVMRTGVPYLGQERLVRLDRDHDGILEDRYFTFMYAPIVDETGTSDRAMAVVNDVTDQVRARQRVEHEEERVRTLYETVRSSEARFRTIFETADVSIWEEDFGPLRQFVETLTAEHGAGLRAFLETNPSVVEEAIGLIRVIGVNRATLQLFGASSTADLIASLSNVFLPETRRTFIDGLLMLSSGERSFSRETALQSLQGRRIDALLTVSVSPAEGGADRVLVTIVDISARKLAESEREARVAEMERAVRFSEMFVSFLGHDLRNPLSAITTAADLLTSRGESERIAAPLNRIVRSADRMDRMIAQLLDFTQVRLGQGLPLERSTVDLRALGRSVIEELKSVHHRDVEFEVIGDVTGEWDRDRLRQLLSNLTANAVLHGTAGGSVLLQVDGSAEDAVRIEVRNAGAVPPQVLSVIFDPLVSRAAHRKRIGSSGLGLGLYVTQQIAVAHGGTIAAESNETHGTRFSVWLPRQPADDRC